MLNSKNLTIVKNFGDKIEFTIERFHCIWNDLRPFLKYLAQPFSSKLRSKEAKGLKSGNLGKQNFFLNINFLLDSIVFLCAKVNFHLEVG